MKYFLCLVLASMMPKTVQSTRCTKTVEYKKNILFVISCCSGTVYKQIKNSD
jgi:hypothetical protein